MQEGTAVFFCGYSRMPAAVAHFGVRAGYGMFSGSRGHVGISGLGEPLHGISTGNAHKSRKDVYS